MSKEYLGKLDMKNNLNKKFVIGREPRDGIGLGMS